MDARCRLRPPDLCSVASGRKVCSSSRRSVHTWLILHCHVSLKLLMYQLQTMGGIRIRFRSAREHRTICVELDGGLVVSDNNRTNRMPHAMYHSSAGHSFLIVRWDPLSGNCRHANCWEHRLFYFCETLPQHTQQFGRLARRPLGYRSSRRML